MATEVKERIRTAAAAYTPLSVILTDTAPLSVFRWYDRLLIPGSLMPAVVVNVISDPKTYAFAGRLPTSSARYQFTLWGRFNTQGLAALYQLEQALGTFLDQLDLVGIPDQVQYNNRIVASRDGLAPATTKDTQGNPQKIIDAMIYANDSL